MKICIGPIESKEQSETVQKRAFKLGYGWSRGQEQEVRQYNISNLYLYSEDNDITWSKDSTISNGTHKVFTPERFLNANTDTSDWTNWIMVEKKMEYESIDSRFEILDL